MGRWSSIGGPLRASDENVKIEGVVLLVYTGGCVDNPPPVVNPPPLLLRPRIRKVAESSQNQGGFDNATLALRDPEWLNCGPVNPFRARLVYVLDVFALGQKPEFVKILLTFGKV